MRAARSRRPRRIFRPGPATVRYAAPAEAVAHQPGGVKVAAEFRVSWRTVHRALSSAAPSGYPRRRRPACWHRREPGPHGAVILHDVGWRRSDPWMTSFSTPTPAARLLLGWRRGGPAAAYGHGSVSRQPSSGRDRAGRHLPVRPIRLRIRAALPRPYRGRPLAPDPTS